MKHLFFSIFSFSILILFSIPALSVPNFIKHQGRILNPDGVPSQGSMDVTYSLYENETGGSAVWTQTLAVTFDDGYYSVILGTGNPSLSSDIFDGNDLYLGTTLEGIDEFMPRAYIVSVPYSIRSEVSDSVVGEVNAIGGLQVDGNQVIDSSGNMTLTGSFTLPQGALSNLPEASNDNKGQLYYSTDEGAVYYSNGIDWINLANAGPSEINMPQIDSLTPSQIEPGQNIALTIDGQTFESGCEVEINGVLSSSVEFTDSTEITADSTELESGAYNIRVINPNGLRNTLENGLYVDAAPVWGTSEGDLGDITDSADAEHFTLEATDAEEQTLAFTVVGGALPDGLSLASDTGIISGDAADVEDSETFTFTLRVTDTANTPNEVDREFSLTVIHGLGLTPGAPGESCKHIYDGGFSIGNGDYWIDAAPGGADPFEIYCDMDNGGWTRMIYDDGNAGNGWNNTEITDCGCDAGNVHGMWGGSPNNVTQTYPLVDIAHSEAKIQITYYAVDSWDNEYGRLYVDGNQVWQKNRTDCCGGGCQNFAEKVHSCCPKPWGGTTCRENVNVTLSHSGNSVEVSVRTTIGSAESDESWAFDDVYVWIK